MPTCETCRNWYFRGDPHQCPPQWRCWFEGWPEDDADTLYADNAPAAAEQLARDYQAGRGVYEDDSYQVFVRRADGTGETTRWEVVAETVMQYRAEPSRHKETGRPHA